MSDIGRRVSRKAGEIVHGSGDGRYEAFWRRMQKAPDEVYRMGQNPAMEQDLATGFGMGQGEDPGAFLTERAREGSRQSAWQEGTIRKSDLAQLVIEFLGAVPPENREGMMQRAMNLLGAMMSDHLNYDQRQTGLDMGSELRRPKAPRFLRELFEKAQRGELFREREGEPDQAMDERVSGVEPDGPRVRSEAPSQDQMSMISRGSEVFRDDAEYVVGKDPVKDEFARELLRATGIDEPDLLVGLNVASERIGGGEVREGEDVGQMLINYMVRGW